jgi:anti-anti-sigma factor
VRVSSAGHPPPVLASAEAPARMVEVPRDPPVGVLAHDPRRSITIDLAPGAVLCFYTDGLVERPDSPLELNLSRLREAVVPAPPESVCRTVMNRLIGNQPSPDDVAILVLRREDSAADRPGITVTGGTRLKEPTAGAVAIFRYDLRLDVGPEELAVARNRFTEWLRLHQPNTTARDELIIAVGEATANAYDHSGANSAPGRAAAWIQAACRHGKVHVTVGDTGRWAIPTPEPRNRGRGRAIMAALTDHLELHTGPDGTVVELVKELSVMTSASTPPPPESGDERLRITVGSTGQMVLAGDLDTSTVPQLHEVLTAATTDPGAGLVLDLQQVGVLQSAAVAELFEQAEHRPLTVVVRTGSAVATVLRVCGLDALARIELRPAPASST